LAPEREAFETRRKIKVLDTANKALPIPPKNNSILQIVMLNWVCPF